MGNASWAMVVLSLFGRVQSLKHLLIEENDMTSEQARRTSELAQEWATLLDRLIEIKREARKNLPLFVALVAAHEKKPRTLIEFVMLVQEAGYVSQARDFPYMVYQALQALIEQGVVEKHRENQSNTYCFVGDAACQ
jgi:hypothetical protein